MIDLQCCVIFRHTSPWAGHTHAATAVQSSGRVWLLWPHGLQPTRLLCPWNSLGKNTGVGGHFLLQRIFPTQGSNLSLLHCRWILTTEPPGKPSYTRYISSLFTIVSPIGHSLSGSSVHGILQARILEWVAILFSRGSSQPRDRTWVSCIAGGFFTTRAISESANVRVLMQSCFSHVWLFETL